MKGTLLIIEDELAFAESVKVAIEEISSSITTEIRDFEPGLAELADILPDVIVLDIFDDIPQKDQKEGLKIWEKIWKDTFIPLIFVSAARLERYIELAEKHPAVEYIVKTESDAIKKIADAVQKFIPLAAGIKSIQKDLCADVRQMTQDALTESALHVSKSTEIKDTLKILSNTARRRLASLLRQKADEKEPPLFAWERYLYPSIPGHLFTGDILKKVGSDNKAPDSYCVVLTPSCDLAHGGVVRVLTAACAHIKEYWKACQFSDNRRKVMGADLRKISSRLNEAQYGGFTPLPAFSNLIPHMAVNMRDLKLFSLEGKEKVKSIDGDVFQRVVSIDNPYRERLIWAYLQIAGRPGVPGCNNKAWIEGIMDCFAEKKEE